MVFIWLFLLFFELKLFYDLYEMIICKFIWMVVWIELSFIIEMYVNDWYEILIN